ncbi:hypothetical protein AWB73_04259 [Caballeronia turbans]|jgi:hypothetical protein|nr:hypothetical protein AWB73_04259 [Caballeronia turbans]
MQIQKNRPKSRFFCLQDRIERPAACANRLTGLRPMPERQPKRQRPKLRQQPKLRRLQRPKRSMQQRLRPKQQQPEPKQPTYRLQRSEQPFR